MKSASCTLFAILCMAATSGCISVPSAPISPSARIAEDATALNDAYGRAVTDQILLNALRSRDRWPRQYVNITGVSNTPNEAQQAQLTLSPLPLTGNGGFGSSTGQLQRSESSQRAYGVQPLDTQTVNQTVLSATPRSTFEHYWNSAWSKDILLLVVGSSLSRVPSQLHDAELRTLLDADQEDAASPRRLLNHPIRSVGRFQYRCEPTPWTDGQAWPLDPAASEGDDDCGYYQVVSNILNYTFEHGPGSITLRDAPKPSCQYGRHIAINRANAVILHSLAEIAGQSANGQTIRQYRAEGASDQSEAQSVQLAHCRSDETPVVLEVHDFNGDHSVVATYVLRLRSLDEVIFAMGSLLRVGNGNVRLAFARVADNDAEKQTVCAGRQVAASGSERRHYIPCAILFSASPALGAPPEQYAAAVNYREQVYVAGPAIGAFHDDAEDRTATVLTLIGQLFALNHSPGASASAPTPAVVSH